NKARDGSYRAIKITLADSGSEKRIALTRPGYTAPLGEGPVRKNNPTGSPTKLKKNSELQLRRE
ncbi:MAG: hypothetical protein ACRD4L_04410, partial [Pyrinomonadaceae bacterium]